jgi:amino acid transporter
MDTEDTPSTKKHAPLQVVDSVETSHVLNASGHKQELERNFGLLSICATGIMTGNVWAALGGSIVVALYNGGPAGVIYELMAVSCCYFMIAACIAEMASAIPSSAGVYHWASVTGGARFGKVIGFYAGWYVQTIYLFPL